MLEHYGVHLGVRNARKHLGWYVEQLFGPGTLARSWRRRLCETDDPDAVRAAIGRLTIECAAVAA
jgi:tRNA-dihydrouridine synthase